MDHHLPGNSRVRRPRVTEKFASFAKKEGRRVLQYYDGAFRYRIVDAFRDNHRTASENPHMSRIPLIEPEEAPPEVRAVYDKFQASGFRIFNVMKMFGNNHRFLEAMYNLTEGVYTHAKLSPRYRELAYLRASQLNSCHY